MKRRISRRTILIGLGVVALLLVIGLALLGRAVDNIFANIRMADCRWGARVQVWLDTDRNGQRYPDEQPVSNVAVRADDVRNNRIAVASGVTNAAGTAELDVFVAGCPETAFEVYIVAPSQFCATTPERLTRAPFTFGVAACAS
jgi:hypothetical protein